MVGKEATFRSLELAIVGRKHIAFDYQKESGLKFYTGVAPFKLINHKGIWYLAARDGEKLKSFSFAKIENLHFLESSFSADPDIDKKLSEEEGIWLNDDKTEIVLKIDCEVAGYFKRRKLIANQIIEKELEDGGLILSAKVGHPNQVVPIVRYWIPHIRIISPEGLQAEMESEIATYLKATR
jgi:predicted DNA-binding transcriptional regulator YafY